MSGQLSLFVVIYLLIPALLWTVATGLNIYRLAGYYQREGYDSKRYLRWLFGRDGERRYLAIAVIGNVVVYAFPHFVPSPLAKGTVLVITAYVFSILHVVWILWRLRHHRAEQRYTSTPRANRLLITVILSALLLPFAVLMIIGIATYGSALINAASLLTTYSLFSGHITMLVVPFALPFANLINRPIDRLLRVQPTAPTS